MLEGDIIEKVEVMMPDQKPITYGRRKDNEPADKSIEPLDPIRLPFQLKQWAPLRWRKDKPGASKPKVKLYLKRENEVNVAGRFFEPDPVKVELDWDDGWQFDQVLALEVNSPQAIPELGLAYLVKNQVDGPENADKLAPVETTNEIINYCFVNRKFDGTIAEGSWRSKALKGAEWASLFQFIQDRPEVTKLKLKVKRGDKEEVIELCLRPIKPGPWMAAASILRAGHAAGKGVQLLEAVEMGFRDTHHSMMQVYLQMRRLRGRNHFRRGQPGRAGGHHDYRLSGRPGGFLGVCVLSGHDQRQSGGNQLPADTCP